MTSSVLNSSTPVNSKKILAVVSCPKKKSWTFLVVPIVKLLVTLLLPLFIFLVLTTLNFNY